MQERGRGGRDAFARSAGDGRYMGVGNVCWGSFVAEHRYWTISKDHPPVRPGRTARTSRAPARHRQSQSAALAPLPSTRRPACSCCDRISSAFIEIISLMCTTTSSQKRSAEKTIRGGRYTALLTPLRICYSYRSEQQAHTSDLVLLCRCNSDSVSRGSFVLSIPSCQQSS